MLGWSSLVNHQPFAATSITLESSQVIWIDGARLRAISKKDPQFGYEFMRRTVLVLANRLNTTWAQLSHLYLSHYLPVTTPSNE
jgi:CRP-like cAMP-binding protein